MFTTCLIELSKALWEVMKSYHHTMLWHQHQDEQYTAASAANTANTGARGGAEGIVVSVYILSIS